MIGSSETPENPGLITGDIPVESDRAQLQFFYLPNGSLGVPVDGIDLGFSVEMMLNGDGVWMEVQKYVVGVDFVDDNTIWNKVCLQIDVPQGPTDIAFRFRVNGPRSSDQIFIDNASLRIE